MLGVPSGNAPPRVAASRKAFVVAINLHSYLAECLGEEISVIRSTAPGDERDRLNRPAECHPGVVDSGRTMTDWTPFSRLSAVTTL